MKVEFWMTGKTSHAYLNDPISQFSKRIKTFIPFEVKELRVSRQKTESQIKTAEEEQVLKLLQASDYLILLDEKGVEYSSTAFAQYIQKLLNQSPHKIVFLTGGAYGFTDAVYERAQGKLALSQLTFTHEMVRIIFLEQLYRAFSILKGEKYHHL